MLLEKTYLPIINFIYNRIRDFSSKTKKYILTICIVIEVLSTYLYQCDEFLGFLCSAVLNSMIGIVCFFGIIVAGIDHKIEKIQAKKWLIYVLMLCGIVVFISGLHHFITYSYMIMGLVMCTMMPAFIIVWGGNKGISILFRMVAWVLSICFAIFIVLNLIVAPISDPAYFVEGRYFGIAADPNGLAKIAVTASTSAIYMIVVQKSIKKIPFICILAIAFVITFLTASRTNLIALVLVCAVALVMIVKSYIIDKEISAKKILVVGCILILVSGMVLIGVSSISNGDNSSTIGSRLSQGLLEDGSVDLNALSSGRINIWTFCIEKTNLIGNDITGGIVDIQSGVDNDHAHNTVIELLYRSGIIAGVCMLLIELYCIGWTIKTIFIRRKNSQIEIISALFITAFLIASMFDIVVLPFAKMTTFLFYLCMPVVFSK